MKTMKRIRRGSSDQDPHRAGIQYCAQVRRKIQAYELHVQIGLIAQGLLHCLAATMQDTVWTTFRGWLRTIRPGIPPSELVGTQALSDIFPEFLLRTSRKHFFIKFIAYKIDPARTPGFRLRRRNPGEEK